MENQTVFKEVNDQGALFLTLCLSSPNEHHTRPYTSTQKQIYGTSFSLLPI